MNRHKINKRFLISIGFIEHENEFAGTRTWLWGAYTVESTSDKRHMHIPIIEWDELTQMAYASPINYRKKITSIHGMDQFINSVNFLMSTEN